MKKYVHINCIRKKYVVVVWDEGTIKPEPHEHIHEYFMEQINWHSITTNA